MKKTIASMLLVTSSLAFAGDHTLNLVGRFGFENANRDSAKSGMSDSTMIKGDWARAYFAGKLNATTKYAMTLNFLDTNAASATGDKVPALVDELYIKKSLMGFDLTLGKQATLFGGVDTQRTGADQYVKSLFWTAADALGSQMGVGLSREIMGHTLSVEAFNGNSDRVTGSMSAQSKMGYAAQLNADFMTGLVKSTLGYTSKKTVRAEGPDNYLGFGVQFNPAVVSVELDYGVKTQVKAGTAKQDKKETTLAAMFSYTGDENFRPFVKYVKDEDKTSATGTKVQDIDRLALGLEYKESKTDATRYHAVVSQETYKPVSGNKYSVKTVMLGAKFDVAVF